MVYRYTASYGAEHPAVLDRQGNPVAHYYAAGRAVNDTEREYVIALDEGLVLRTTDHENPWYDQERIVTFALPELSTDSYDLHTYRVTSFRRWEECPLFPEVAGEFSEGLSQEECADLLRLISTLWDRIVVAYEPPAEVVQRWMEAARYGGPAVPPAVAAIVTGGED